MRNHNIPPGVAIALAILFLLGVAGVVASCVTPPRQTTDVSVMADLTEPLIAWPKDADVLSQFELEADQNNGATFHLTTISDVRLNPETVYTLPAAGSNISTNRFTRKREVAAFVAHIQESIQTISADTVIGRDHSSIFEPMARELTRLSQSTATRRVLILYSDLQEHTPEISFYDKRTISLLESQPDSIEALLTRHTPLPDLSGITVYFIYQAKDVAHDEAFSRVSRFYKALFEKRHATVIIQANVTR